MKISMLAAWPRRFATAIGAVCCSLAVAWPALSWAQLSDPATALRDYVNTPDAAYTFTAVASLQQADLSVYVLSMNSQNWRSAAEMDRTLWQHWMVILVPQQVRSTTAALIIGGGRNTAQPPPLTATEIAIGAQLARASGTVVAVLGQAPNQPLTPADVATPLSEDALVAYTWRKAMDTGDWSWPAYLPMVKSAVRAMDTAQAFVPTVRPGASIERFIAIGFSKRGATTFLTAAIDPRITAMAPGVFDALDLDRQFEHHFESLGFYSEAMVDYVNNAIPRRVRSPEGQDLLRVVDPFTYRRLLALPKFLIRSSGDQFFMPDGGRFYDDKLPGETLLRHVPNTDHSLSSSAGITDVLTSLVAWYQQVAADAPRPVVTAQVRQGKLQVHSSLPATQARLWQASSASGRDFRRVTTGEVWQATALTDEGDGAQSKFSVALPAPPQGYTASFVELTFPGVAGVPQTYSTRIHVTPDVAPFEVVDAIHQPRGPAYWQRQVDAALAGRGPAEVDAATLRSYLPIALFGDHLNTLEALRATLRAEHGPRDEARRQCLATRLNIGAAQLGWYSPVSALGLNDRPLWWHYRQADAAFSHHTPQVAWVVCAGLNAARAETQHGHHHPHGAVAGGESGFSVMDTEGSSTQNNNRGGYNVGEPAP